MKPLAQNTLIQNRYLIVHLIGKGGMGEVYLAVDQRLGSAVALKRTFFAADDMLSGAFEREARILARLRHPVLPKVSDHFSEGEQQYLVMEHIAGDDLAKRLEAAQKPFPLSWVMFWADQLLDALAYLHSHEPPIIHRDIKPQNLKLTDENHVILLDFGLSKSSTGQTNVTDPSGNTSGSSTGSVVGYTPHYAPMEQIRGIGTNPKSDLYSLSATLYQLLSNEVPPDALSRADAMLNGKPDPIMPLSDLNSEVPRNVSDVILKAMEVSQEKRFESAKEMQRALRKAYAQMQDQMSAATVVMSAQGTSVSDSVPMAAPSEKTEVMDFGGNVIGASQASEAATNVMPSTPSVPPETAAYVLDSGVDEVPRQSDIKTEVFLAGSNSIPMGEPISAEPPPASMGEVAPPMVEDFGVTEDFRANDEPAVVYDDSTSSVGDATMPIVAFESGASVNSPGNGDSFSSPEPGELAYAGNVGAAISSGATPSYSAVAATPAKRSVGKIVAILGGLFVLFIIVAGAAGGGWYYYANYYAAAADPEPTPQPTVEITPSPEPTVETAVETNTNVNSNSEVSTVEPTPEPEPETTGPVVTRPTTPQPQTRATPVRTQATPVPRPTPKPTSTRDRKIILQ